MSQPVISVGPANAKWLRDLPQSELPADLSTCPRRLIGEASQGVNIGATLSSQSDRDQAEVSTAGAEKMHLQVISNNQGPAQEMLTTAVMSRAHVIGLQMESRLMNRGSRQ